MNISLIGYNYKIVYNYHVIKVVWDKVDKIFNIFFIVGVYEWDT